MRKLLDANFVDPATSDYPKGRVRDKAGAVQGTTGNEILFGDLMQFFQKLVIDAGITENDLPENVTNGYQLLDALKDKINKVRGINPTLQTYTLNTPFNAGTFDILAETADRTMYVRPTGMSTDYIVTITLGGVAIASISQDSYSFNIPAGIAAQLVWVNGTGDITIYEQNIGI